MDTLPMFDTPTVPPVKSAGEPTGRRSTPTKPDPARIRWTKYRPKQRVACDDCLADLLEAGGGPVARAARFRRQQHGADRLLCGAHMELRRELDGFDPLDDANGRLA